MCGLLSWWLLASLFDTLLVVYVLFLVVLCVADMLLMGWLLVAYGVVVG